MVPGPSFHGFFGGLEEWRGFWYAKLQVEVWTCHGPICQIHEPYNQLSCRWFRRAKAKSDVWLQKKEAEAEEAEAASILAAG